MFKWVYVSLSHSMLRNGRWQGFMVGCVQPAPPLRKNHPFIAAQLKLPSTNSGRLMKNKYKSIKYFMTFLTCFLLSAAWAFLLCIFQVSQIQVPIIIIKESTRGKKGLRIMLNLHLRDVFQIIILGSNIYFIIIILFNLFFFVKSIIIHYHT